MEKRRSKQADRRIEAAHHSTPYHTTRLLHASHAISAPPPLTCDESWPPGRGQCDAYSACRSRAIYIHMHICIYAEKEIKKHDEIWC